MRRALAALTLAIAAACAPQPVTLSDAQMAAIADSAKTVVTAMVDDANKGDMSAMFSPYSNDPAARFTENGMLYGSLDSMKVAYARMSASLDTMSISVDRWDSEVLGPDAVGFTVPFHLKLKPKGKRMLDGTGVWTGVVRRGTNRWELVQSHESWANAGPIMAAVSPVKP